MANNTMESVKNDIARAEVVERDIAGLGMQRPPEKRMQVLGQGAWQALLSTNISFIAADGVLETGIRVYKAELEKELLDIYVRLGIATVRKGDEDLALVELQDSLEEDDEPMSLEDFFCSMAGRNLLSSLDERTKGLERLMVRWNPHQDVVEQWGSLLACLSRLVWICREGVE